MAYGLTSKPSDNLPAFHLATIANDCQVERDSPRFRPTPRQRVVASLKTKQSVNKENFTMNNEGTRVRRVVERQFLTTALNLSIRVCVIACLTLLFTGLYAFAQEGAPNSATSSTLMAAASASSPVPRLIRFAGVAKDSENKPLAGITGINFLLYKDQEGGAPLWMETQNVQSDSSGRYSVQLGATKPDGLPTDVFTSGEARWLAVQVSGQSEQPRVLLLSVPYALKAADAETIGGLPPSAFVMAASNTSPNGNSNGVQGGNGNAAPGEALNRGEKPGPQTKTLNYVAKFTTAKGAVGNSLIFDNGTDVGISTSTPAYPLDVKGTVNASSYNLAGEMFAFGSYANNNAYLGFSGNSSITGQNNTSTGFGALFSTNSGAQNTAIGTFSLYTNTTGTANTATGWLALEKNLNGIQNTAAGVQALEKNTSGNNNTADGVFSLFENTTGGSNTAIGSSALNQNIGGSYNTAAGNGALEQTTGSFNTAAGNLAGYYNVAGSGNTALGDQAGPDSSSPSLSNATAIGAYAIVSESNALTLGCIAGVNSCTAGVDVGIGENTPSGPLHITGPAAAPPGSLPAAHNGLLLGTNGTSSYKWIQSYGGPLAINPTGSNNVGIGTATPAHHLDMGDGAYEQSGVWQNASDRDLKANFSPVNGPLLLTHLNNIPMLTWNYRTDDRSVRHLGPMAQDFYAAFGLDGRDDKHISTVDEGGVALAAVQQLYRMVLKGNAEVANLARSNREKDVQIQNLKAEVQQLQQLEQTVRVLSTRLSKIEAEGDTGSKILRASK
jgi:hypothetical protein